MRYLVGLALLLAALGLATTAQAFSRGGAVGGFSAPRGGGGFNMGSDVNSSRAPSSYHPQGGANSAYHPNTSNPNYNRNPSTTNTRNNGNTYNNAHNNGNTYNNNAHNNGNTYNNNTYNNVNVNRTVVANPVYSGPAWGWNHGVAWYPAPAYWGGGFWGAMAIGVTSAAVFGSIVNSSGQTVTSYQVQQTSPGATLLQNYGLTQTQCGPPNLVVMYGPNNSVICAYPNNTVSAGTYNINTSTLSLTSA